MFDCIIIGGGPSGLTCAIYLARFQRSVLLIENGKYRNYASQGVHGFLGYDGVKPMTLITAARKEALKYGVTFYKSTVTKLKNKNKFFEVNCDSILYKSKIIVMAYGVRDILPEIEGIEKYYGKSVYHCPVCDGYEIMNKKVGLTGNPENSIHLALELKQWTENITLFCGNNVISSYLKKKLEKNKIGVVEKSITKLAGDKNSFKYVVLSDGEKINFDAIFFCSNVLMSCKLHEDINCRMDDRNKIQVNKCRQTNIEGAFAIGDIISGPQLVVKSCADGAIAAIEINKKLIKVK
ncbi:MAG: NAD(P)/FAD-dependent oxidoreductase [bacterium]